MSHVKTHNFENEDEAKTYVYDILTGKPELPTDVWVQILSNNSELSIKDIQQMCKVNIMFKEICDTGAIWDKIYMRQFGLEAFKLARAKMPKDSLARLFTTRFMNMMSPGPRKGLDYTWKLVSNDPKPITFKFTATAIDAANTRAYSFEFINRSFSQYQFEFIQQFIDTLVQNTSVRKMPSIHEDRDIYISWIIGRRNKADFEEWIIYYLFKHNYSYKGDKKYIVDHMQMGQCVVCKQEAEMLCGACKQQWYCGNECAQKDWELKHYVNCNYNTK